MSNEDYELRDWSKKIGVTPDPPRARSGTGVASILPDLQQQVQSKTSAELEALRDSQPDAGEPGVSPPDAEQK